MKFLHVADLHLDRSFEGIKDMPSHVLSHLSQANKKMFTNIVDRAIDNQVDAVLFVGDTFHQHRTSIQTQNLFFNQLQRLNQADIAVFMLFGNHDYYEEDNYWFDFPDNVHLFQSEEVLTQYFVTKNQETVAISGFSYEHPHIAKSKIDEYPLKDHTVNIHIGLYHGEVATQTSENPFAPFQLASMKEKGYDYWALGHIHQPQVLNDMPPILYSGTPQGHTKKETATQGVVLVTIEGGKTTTAFIDVAQVKWEQYHYSLKDSQTLQEVLTKVSAFLMEKTTIIPDVFQLQALHFTDSDHLNEAFHLAFEKNEILQYLQEKSQIFSNQKAFPYSLSKENQASKKTVLHANPKLLEQLALNYLEPSIFHYTLEELLKNPQFHSNVIINQEWRKKAIQQALMQLNEDFVIQEGHYETHSY